MNSSERLIDDTSSSIPTNQMDEFLKTVQPSVVTSKELDIVLKEMFRWVIEKAYVPTSQENRISLTYNSIPFGSGVTAAYCSSLALKRIGVQPGVMLSIPVALIGLSAVATSARYSRKAVNYKLMQLRTPMGEKMIDIIQSYRKNPQNYQELSNTDFFSYRKHIQEALKKNQEMKQDSLSPSSSIEEDLSSQHTNQQLEEEEIQSYTNSFHSDDLRSKQIQDDFLLDDNKSVDDLFLSINKNSDWEELPNNFYSNDQFFQNSDFLDQNQNKTNASNDKKFKTWDEIRRESSI